MSLQKLKGKLEEKLGELAEAQRRTGGEGRGAARAQKET